MSLAVTSYVHGQTWRHDYRHAPVREEFLAFTVASALAAVLVALAARRPLGRGARVVLLTSMGLAMASLAAFALSRGPGLPTVLHGQFREHGIETTASYVASLGSAKVSLVAETLAVVLCGIGLLGTPRRGRPVAGAGSAPSPRG